jgi:hypothetical protein
MLEEEDIAQKKTRPQRGRVEEDEEEGVKRKGSKKKGEEENGNSNRRFYTGFISPLPVWPAPRKSHYASIDP